MAFAGRFGPMGDLQSSIFRFCCLPKSSIVQSILNTEGWPIMANGKSMQEIGSLASGDRPVIETLARMTLDTMENCHLDARSYFLVRLAGLAASDAPPISYLLNAAGAADVLEPDDLRGVLIALAPVIGSARTTAAAGNMLRAYASAMNIQEALAEAEEKQQKAMSKAR
jgi:hypothetical protein